jgi:hypothetical protein
MPDDVLESLIASVTLLQEDVPGLRIHSDDRTLLRHAYPLTTKPSAWNRVTPLTTVSPQNRNFMNMLNPLLRFQMTARNRNTRVLVVRMGTM